MRSQLHRQMAFTLGMLLFGGLEAALAWGIVGSKGVEGVAYSVTLCLIPGWLTIFVSGLLSAQPELAAYAVLVGTGVRMVFVLLGLFVISSIRPDLGFREFQVWLIVGYLVSLALETWMVLLPTAPNPAE